jgi:hypothetical protein
MRRMTLNPIDLRQLRYEENVRVPAWVIGLLALILGLTAGAMTGVAVRNIVGDDPLITGSDAAVFYVAFGLAVLVDIFVLVNFTNLSVTVADRGFEFRYGVFGKSFPWEQIKSAEPHDYRWTTYGGWGIRWATQGRRAWSQLGAKEGVVVEVDENGKKRSYFVSSRKPQELAGAIRRGIEERGSPAGATAAPAGAEKA